MSVNVAIGVQDFSTLIENHYFYVDKTAFLKEWWDSGDSVTLITRPRRSQWNMRDDLICLRSWKSGMTRNTAICREHILSLVFHLQI